MSASKDSLPELPPLTGDDENLDLGWHALNYRTADTRHAQAMWEELERYVREWGLACYQAGLERAAVEAERIRDLYDRVSARDMILMGDEIAAAIRSEKQR